MKRFKKHLFVLLLASLAASCCSCGQNGLSETDTVYNYLALPACDAASSFIYQGVKYDCYAQEEMISVHFREWPAADLSAGPLAYLINECDYEKFSGRYPSASFAYSKGDPLYLKWTEDGSLDDIAAIYPIKGLENPTWLGLTALYEDAPVFAVYNMKSAGDGGQPD